ncbi:MYOTUBULARIN-LIKE PROTEIN [Salix purpurea]|uniref:MYOTUBULARIN-LIKE PROTEIN n=1 Tax=Salix purpurea TaxID=77065 RepID=A0A9Q0PBY8_SALPP|nr:MYOTUBULARIN-LIKE PROTEIN [Salix purpurea]
MGNGYNHHLRHQNNHLHQKSTFLPMLCSRPAIKDVTVPKWDDRPVSISSADPLSPKIGCMGQVKRNNKIVGFPTPNKLTIATTKTSTANVRYSKLKRIFSGKNLTSAAASIATSTAHRRRKVVVNGASGAKIDDSKESSVSVSIENMDPPLPVVKRPTKDVEANSLWKRRSGGLGLKNLQLQEIQLNRSCLAPTTV